MASSSHRWQRVQALFYEGLELRTEERRECLDKNCDGDADLKREVETLLESAEKPMDFLKKSVLEIAHEMTSENGRRPVVPGSQLGHYEIVSLLGVGGMGQVYLATDLLLKRKVA